MLRQFDWTCCDCGHRTDELVDYADGEPRPSVGDTTNKLTCPCGSTTHQRAPSLTAPYPGEKPFNPVIKGGSWDTAGNVQLHDIPTLPGAEDHGRRAAAKVSQAIAAGVTGKDLEAVRSDAIKAGPSDADYTTHWDRPEVKELEAKNKVIDKQNAEKRARLGAINRGENINMRRDKCAGDPADITA